MQQTQTDPRAMRALVDYYTGAAFTGKLTNANLPPAEEWVDAFGRVVAHDILGALDNAGPIERASAHGRSVLDRVLTERTRAFARVASVALIAGSLLFGAGRTSAHDATHHAGTMHPRGAGAHATRIRDDATRWYIYGAHPERFYCFAGYALAEDLTCIDAGFRNGQ